LLIFSGATPDPGGKVPAIAHRPVRAQTSALIKFLFLFNDL
jgi:hypothetical protein